METTGSETIDPQQIQGILDERIKAVYERDEQTILAQYAPGVISYDLAPPLKNVGVDAIKQRLQKWFGSYSGHITQEVADVVIEGSGDIAHTHFMMRTYGTSVKGEAQDMWYRGTMFFKNMGGQWLITHEHISDPVDMTTGKIIFDLKP